jgi:NADPH-dependent glutamate synthase beta subunit-like oxidoreductase
MRPTDISDPEYFHKVVDCQWACPAHTPVPEYIRLIADGKYTDAYMINWESNVFPGILGRTCDRPCEPACRRVRVEDEPVAICRLKRVAADYKDDITDLIPKAPKKTNGKKIALLGAGPVSLAVARDLVPLGYECTAYERDHVPGGLMRTNIPSFRLPAEVLDEECNQIINMGLDVEYNYEVKSFKEFLKLDHDAVFIGTGAPKGKDLNLPGREEASKNIHIGIDFLASVAFEHVSKVGKKVIVLGGGNTAMDCCRTAVRLGGESVGVYVRSPQADMKASDWEIEEAEMENIPIFENHVPKKFLVKEGKLWGMLFEKVTAQYDENNKRKLIPTGEPLVTVECDDVLMAIGQDNAFEWIEKDIGIEFNEWDMPTVDKKTMQSTLPKVFFGGDAAWGPENIITAVAHAHEVAISIDLYCNNLDLIERPAPHVFLKSSKMGLHEWSYDNGYDEVNRLAVPHADLKSSLKDRKLEVELGYDEKMAFEEASRCLNCDAQTVFEESRCIECDACVDICPEDCINFIENDEEEALRLNLRVPALNLAEDLYVSDILPTARVMVKDEDLCLHCGLCAERCPTGAWDMQKFFYMGAQAKDGCSK